MMFSPLVVFTPLKGTGVFSNLSAPKPLGRISDGETWSSDEDLLL